MKDRLFVEALVGIGRVDALASIETGEKSPRQVIHAHLLALHRYAASHGVDASEVTQLSEESGDFIRSTAPLIRDAILQGRLT